MVLPFRDSEERDDLRWKIANVNSVGRLLDAVHRDPALAEYRGPVVGVAPPKLPSVAEIEQARNVLERAAACLVHHYGQRRRPDDPDLLGRTAGDMRRDDFF
ncbi:hypothetical protein [Acidisphaera sp. L21]|uniref:hypothetical protein n=1 Tax=Acidisphaera sp. L21 TaxID=1641851 RepID=UPI00131AD2BB|nr:hypothetical protein [Acidisphaera sp. L21]